jgi:hypothetical protein
LTRQLERKRLQTRCECAARFSRTEGRENSRPLCIPVATAGWLFARISDLTRRAGAAPLKTHSRAPSRGCNCTATNKWPGDLSGCRCTATNK